MTALSRDRDLELIGRGHYGPGTCRKCSFGKPGQIVHAVNSFDTEALEQPVFCHGEPARSTFFGGLEDHHHGAIEIARPGQILGGTKQHGTVPVMAAGVHQSLICAGMLESSGFRDRQRVHICAQSDDPPARAAVNDADHPRAPYACFHFVDAKAFEQLGNFSSGAMNLIEQFGMRMEIATPGGDLLVHVGNRIDDGQFGSP